MQFRKSKRGWIKIVEAFVAILIIAGILLVVINKGDIWKESDSSKIYTVQLSILREIELNDALRQQILGVNPLPSEDIPAEVNNTLNNRIPAYLECRAKICALDVICALDEYIEGDVYAQSVAITAELSGYSPRQLKLFCWKK